MQGWCEPALLDVKEKFAETTARSAAGSALAVWHDGRLVVDLWGGAAAGGRSWQRGTLAMPYSVGKPLSAVCVLLLVERGLVDLDAPMRRYWPELTSTATVRQVLCHSAGLVLLSEPAPWSAFLDWRDLCRRLAAQEPAWPPGSAVGESALFYGHLLGEIVRRVDGRSLGRFLAEEVAAPHDLDLHVGVATRDLPRVADLVASPAFSHGGGGPMRAAAVANPPGIDDVDLMNTPVWRRAEVPAINAHVTARAVASFYAELAGGGILARETLAEMTAVQASGVDQVMGGEARWGLGVSIDDAGWGMGGLGGSFGWWCEEGGYALAYVTAELGGFERVDSLEAAFRSAVGLPPLAG